MPWIPRSQWIRRHFGNYYGRARSFRRHYYQRPWFSRRRGYRYGRRRRIRARRLRVRKRWMVVRQTNPLVRRRCVIRGWMPALWCDRVSPFYRPMLVTGTLDKDMSGGWTLHELSLKNFYSEHRVHRNLWSQTNCGFDLARYHGTKITFWPHQTCDYIVWWDSDYGDIAEYKKMVKNVHPAILLNRRHVKLVLSVQTTRRFTPKTIYIKPPSRARNEWRTMKEFASFPLGLFAVSVIDFRYPFIPPGFTIYNPVANRQGWTPEISFYDITASNKNKLTEEIGGRDTFTLNQLWFNAGGGGRQPATKWVDEWPGWVGKEGNYNPVDKETFVAVALGPFVKKEPSAECQIIATYRSYWTWGGDVLTRDETICDPETYDPKAGRARLLNDPRWYLEPRDIRKDGYIKPDVFKRLTTAPTRQVRFTHYPGEETSEGETDQEIGALPFEDESSEEEEDFSAQRSRLSRRRMDGGRVEQLVRLRYLLSYLMTNKRSHSV
nr:MAG: ORF1 [Giant panda anellovirus]